MTETIGRFQKITSRVEAGRYLRFFSEQIFILCGVSGVLIPTSPLNFPFAYRDSGVFLYMGWRILHGELPYRDLWDHKPPVVHYLNAAGVAITDQSSWGVWLIEFIALFTAALLGFHLIKKSMGTVAALLSSMLWLLTLVFLITGGNLSTEYALPLQFAALWLIYPIDKPDFRYRRFVIIGVLGALAFLTKQTTIGIWAAILIYLTLHRLTTNQGRRWVREISGIAAGGLAVLASVAIFFGVQGVLPQFWSAAFEYNFGYSTTNTSLLYRLAPVLTGIKPLASTGLFQVALIGYVAAFVLLFFNKSRVANWAPLLAVGLISLPLELILVSASGRTYAHYYMTLLPVLALLAGVMFWVFGNWLASWKLPVAAQIIFVLGVTAMFLWVSSDSYRNQVRAYRENRYRQGEVNYLKTATGQEDYVLLWGAEAYAHYFAQRKSPTRFFYQYPLYHQYYADEQMIEEFLEDVIQKRPRLIVDTKNPDTPVFTFPIRNETIDDGLAYLQSNYREVDTVGLWTIYEYLGDPP